MIRARVTFMPSITADLIRRITAATPLERGIETGAYLGDGLKQLAVLLQEAISIELSPKYAHAASVAVRGLPNARVIEGHSVDVIPTLVDGDKPTLWFLDGHWSAGDTAGADAPCPLLGEIDAMAGGHRDDVVIIDDARLLCSSPPPPHRPGSWPTLIEVLDAVRALHPNHHVTLLNDQVLAVPFHVRYALDGYAALHPADRPVTASPWRAVVRRVRGLGR